jgi:multidrug efflux system membrane fusion protein
MDGDGIAEFPAETHIRRAAGDIGLARPRTVRWLTIVGLLVVVVLGALYGFNRYRSQAITRFFATMKPPPAEVSAVTAKLMAVPHFAAAIGSLAAVHQVTVSPEVGGRVTRIFFTAGQHVAAGDPLVQLNDMPDRGDLANYEAQARWAEISLQRAQTLHTKQFASQENVDQVQAQYDEAKAQIAKTEAIIAEKLIRAPFAGRLGVRQVEVGQYLSPGAAIVTLTDLGKLYVNLTLPSQLRAKIAVGQPVEVTADAYPNRGFAAKVTAIEPQISPDTRAIQVQATMDNAHEALLPGMFVDAHVVLPRPPDSVVLPATAVDYTLYGDSVYVVKPAGTDAAGKPLLKAVRVAVTTGARWDNKIAILDGIKPGDEVVAAGQIKLQDGAPIVISGAPPPQPPKQPTLN